ncbi:MAG: insulinase family protein [Candidatus Omnitrophica bacterium]|nr:insulinase family protein [Candidatus Omnitrophota bacterium]
MKRPIRLLILTLGLFLSIAICSTAEEAAPLKSFPQWDAHKTVLPNGLTVILRKIPSSKLISIDARVNAGSTSEDNYAGTGIAHFVEHMIFKGTSKRGVGELEKEVRGLGGIINGSTSYDYTAYTITMPAEKLILALDALSDSLFYPIFNRAEIKKERDTILKEIRLNNDDPIRHISRLLWETVFREHPYHNPIIGYEELFLKLTRDDLVRFHEKMYIPNNMTLVVAGDLEYHDAMASIEEYFGRIERSTIKPSALPSERDQISKRVLEVGKDLSMAYFALGYRSIDVHNSDMAALDTLAAVLGQGESSRLNSVLYRKKGLVYSIGCWNYTPRDPGIFIISGVTEPKKLKAALGAISEEINALRQSGIDSEELERVKVMLTADYINSLETVADQARDMAINEMLTGDLNFTKRYLENLNSVSGDDVKRVAELYLNDNSLTIVALSPLSGDSKVPESVKDKNGAIEKFTLENGLRCIVRRDDTIPSVSLIVACLGGLRAETAGNAGISNLTGLMMLKGTPSMAEEEISRLVESSGGMLSHFSGNNSVGIRLNILNDRFDKALELLSDIIREPVFPEEALEREKNTVLASIKAVDDDIFSTGMKLFKETLYREHPYRFQTIGTTASVSALSQDDLKSFHKEYFVPENMVIGIFGDIDPADAKKRVTDAFSAMDRKGMPAFTKIREPEQKAVRQVLKNVKKEQSVVLMGFKGALLTGGDHYVLQLISASLSGISGRLSAKLREKLGIAYAVGAISVPAYDPGYFTLYIATTKDNIERAKDEFIRQVKLLNKKGLTEQELRISKSELIGNQLIALQGNDAMAYQTILDELYGLGYENYLEYPDYINSITNDTVIETARKYLNPNSFTLVTIEGE